jgi:hypothetical protein
LEIMGSHDDLLGFEVDPFVRSPESIPSLDWAIWFGSHQPTVQRGQFPIRFDLRTRFRTSQQQPKPVTRC